MAERKVEWPERGDLVLATIESITTYGAYAKLDEYDRTALLHISEISSSFLDILNAFFVCKLLTQTKFHVKNYIMFQTRNFWISFMSSLKRQKNRYLREENRALGVVTTLNFYKKILPFFRDLIHNSSPKKETSRERYHVRPRCNNHKECY